MGVIIFMGVKGVKGVGDDSCVAMDSFWLRPEFFLASEGHLAATLWASAHVPELDSVAPAVQT